MMYRMKDLRRLFNVKDANQMEALLRAFPQAFPPTQAAPDAGRLGAREWPEVAIDDLARKFREHKTNGDKPHDVFRKMFNVPLKPRGGAVHRNTKLDEIHAMLSEMLPIIRSFKQ